MKKIKLKNWYKKMSAWVNKSWCDRMGAWITILLGVGSMSGFMLSMVIKQYDYNMLTASNKDDITEIKVDMRLVREDINNLKIIASNTSKSLDIIQKIVLSWDESYGCGKQERTFVVGALDPK